MPVAEFLQQNIPKMLTNALAEVRNKVDGSQTSCWYAMLAAFEQYGDDFRFGIQSNGTVLTNAQYDVLMESGVAIGLSLDSSVDEIVTRTRRTWAGHSIYAKVLEAMSHLRGYPNYSVI